MVYQSREDKYTTNSMIRGTDSRNQHSRHGRMRAYMACAKALRQHSTEYIQGLARKWWLKAIEIKNEGLE